MEATMEGKGRQSRQTACRGSVAIEHPAQMTTACRSRQTAQAIMAGAAH